MISTVPAAISICCVRNHSRSNRHMFSSASLRDASRSTVAYACMRAREHDSFVQIRVTTRTRGAMQPVGGIWDAWSSTRRRRQASQMLANMELQSSSWQKRSGERDRQTEPRICWRR